jgi:HAMP domain-containing protein
VADHIAGAPVARDRIILFAAAFDVHPTSEISDLAKNLAALPPTASTGNPRLGEVARLLSALKNVLNKTAKNTVLTDVGAIEKLLVDRASMELGAFVQMVGEGVAPRDARRLGRSI